MHKKPHKLSIILFFDSLFRVRYACLRDDYNFDKTMFAPLKKTEVKKGLQKKGLVFTYFFVRLISLTFRTIWLLWYLYQPFSIKKVKTVTVVIAINVLHVKRLENCLPNSLQTVLKKVKVSGKLPTYPSPKSSFCFKWEVSVNLSLGEG